MSLGALKKRSSEADRLDDWMMRRKSSACLRSSPRVSTMTPGRRVATSGLPSCYASAVALDWHGFTPTCDKLSKVLESAVNFSTGLAT